MYKIFRLLLMAMFAITVAKVAIAATPTASTKTFELTVKETKEQKIALTAEQAAAISTTAVKEDLNVVDFSKVTKTSKTNNKKKGTEKKSEQKLVSPTAQVVVTPVSVSGTPKTLTSTAKLTPTTTKVVEEVRLTDTEKAKLKELGVSEGAYKKYLSEKKKDSSLAEEKPYVNFSNHVRLGGNLTFLRSYEFEGDKNIFTMKNSDTGADGGAFIELKAGWVGVEVDTPHTMEVTGKVLGSYLGTNMVTTQEAYAKIYYTVAPKVETTFGIGLQKVDVSGTWSMGGFAFKSGGSGYGTKVQLGVNYQAFKYLIIGATYELGGPTITNSDPGPGPTFPDEQLKQNSQLTFRASVPLF